MKNKTTEKIVQSYFDALNESDFDALLELLHEEVMHDPNGAERQIGKPVFRVHCARTKSEFDEILSDISVMVEENGNRAAAEYTRRGTYLKTVNGLPPADGQAYSVQGGCFFDIDDGLITRVSSYFNKSELVRQLTEI